MFRKMQRSKQSLSHKDIENILEKNTNGILGINGDNGYPYTVPLSFVYFNKKIYFHCVQTGHKIDAIKKNPKVSFTIVDKDIVVSEKYTTYFRSIIAFGRAEIIEEGTERIEAFRALAQKYSGNLPQAERERKVQNCKATIVGVEIEHISGKQAIELVNN